jgi:hypothetical protein
VSDLLNFRGLYPQYSGYHQTYLQYTINHDITPSKLKQDQNFPRSPKHFAHWCLRIPFKLWFEHEKHGNTLAMIYRSYELSQTIPFRYESLLEDKDAIKTVLNYRLELFQTLRPQALNPKVRGLDVNAKNIIKHFPLTSYLPNKYNVFIEVASLLLEMLGASSFFADYSCEN